MFSEQEDVIVLYENSFYLARILAVKNSSGRVVYKIHVCVVSIDVLVKHVFLHVHMWCVCMHVLRRVFCLAKAKHFSFFSTHSV